MEPMHKRNGDVARGDGEWTRAAMLLLICATGIGSFFCFDIPVALGLEVLNDLDMDVFEYGALYSVYFLPNIGMVFYGTKLLNYIGIRWSLVIYTSCVMVGQALITVGYRGKSYFVIVFGRVMFGIGGETMAAVQNAAVSRWFSGDQLSQAYSVVLTVSRLGSILCFAFIPSLTQDYGGEYAVWIGNYLCIASFVASLIYSILDYRSDDMEDIQEINFSDEIDLRTLKHLSPTYWWATCVGMSFYMAVFCFVPFSMIYLEDEKGMSPMESGFEVMVVFLIPLLFGSLAKTLVNRLGIRGLLMSIALVALIPVFFIFALADVSAIYGMVTMGVSHLLISATLFPSVTLLVDSNELGVALGLFQAILDFGLYLGPIAAGAVIEIHGFPEVMYLFGAISCAGFVLSVFLNMTAHGSVLNSYLSDGSSLSITDLSDSTRLSQ
eukprot:TRINITY_DN5658_c0_g1_i1.p1 TRINITY_DN5658_c0_g1~~TRINITY_DN5658_c0_g1_i1.p1  ORF type:complete len:438 (-),score=91.92 TRINITY_DN5658_c0_g1_i1:276-1589(-)